MTLEDLKNLRTVLIDADSELSAIAYNRPPLDANVLRKIVSRLRDFETKIGDEIDDWIEGRSE